jgi:hypothetical protein
MGDPLTFEQTADQIESAMKTAHKLPGPRSLKVGNTWEMILLYAPERSTKMPTEEEVMQTLRQPPSLAQVEAFDQVYEWLTWATVPRRKLLIMRGEGESWRAIGRAMGIKPSSAEALWIKAIRAILFHHDLGYNLKRA